MKLFETLVQPTEEAERIQKRLKEINYPLAALDNDVENLIDYLIDYTDSPDELEDLIRWLKDAGRHDDADRLANSEDDETADWVRICSDTAVTHVYAICWRLRRAISLLKE